MLSRFPFLSCWATQVCSKSVLGGNSIIKQQVRGLVSQVNSHARWRAFTTDSHSPPSVSDLLPLHGQGSRHRTADTWPKHSCPSRGLWGPARLCETAFYGGNYFLSGCQHHGGSAVTYHCSPALCSVQPRCYSAVGLFTPQRWAA